MDRTVRIQDTKRFQFGPKGGATVTDETAPDSNVTINGSVDTPNGTLGDLSTVSPDSDGGSGTPSPDNGGTSISNPDIGSGDGDGESKPKADIDCGWDTRTAQGGVACVGDQTTENDDSAAEGYVKACEDVDCASGDGGAAFGNKELSGEGFVANECDRLNGGVLGCGGTPSERLNNGGGSSSGGSSGGGGSGGSSGGGHSSDRNSDSGYIAPGI